MKKNNKGFSLVELIIVIAIMAILAGALAPALIKYINKSRRSTDISNADTLRTAVQTALSNPEAADVAKDSTYGADALANDTDAFTKEVHSVIGDTTLKAKYGRGKGSYFQVKVNVAANTVVVEDAKGTQISPTPAGEYAD